MKIFSMEVETGTPFWRAALGAVLDYGGFS
jgi:hypothetical protein